MLEKIRMFFIAVCLVAGIFTSLARADQNVVIIGQNLSVYQMVLNGFKGTAVFNAQEFILSEFKDASDMVRRIKRLDPAIVCAIGPEAAQIAKLNFPGKPVVFSLVANPFQFNLSGKGVAGVSLDVSPQDQFDYLKKLMPQARTVGVIYNPVRNKMIIEEASQVASSRGLKLVTKPVSDKSEVSAAIRELEGVGIDAFWLIPDPVVANGVVYERLLLFSFSRKVPLICPASVFVKKGGLFSVYSDYSDLGRQMAKIANDVFGGSLAENIGIQWPAKMKLVINSNTADKLGITIPAELASEAELVR